jgi:hypothetical protein
MDVRTVLTWAQRSRARVELEPLTMTTRMPVALTARIEHVLEDAFVVSQPVVDGVVRPLGRFETYRLAIASPQGRMTGDTQALGRIKIATAGDALLYGYRLSLPPRIQISRRRRDLEILMGRDTVREGELYIINHRGPVLGLVEEVSATGARLLCRNGRNHIAVGQDAFLKLDLPDPLGPIREMVSVTSVDPDEETGCLNVRVAFEKRNQRISDVLRRARSGAALRRRSV